MDLERLNYQEAELEASLISTRRDQFGESYEQASEHLDEDTRQVVQSLNEAQSRVEQRRSLIEDLSEDEKINDLNELRATMFGRKKEAEAFHELSDLELALLEDQIESYEQQGRLKVVDHEIERLIQSYRVIRHDLLAGHNGITPRQFREASQQITGILFSEIRENLEPQNTIVMLPWRAGLAFGDAAAGHGYDKFYHLGAKRNEKTLETEIYFEEKPEIMNNGKNAELKALIADPMLASGNTMIDGIKRLINQGVKEENIVVCSIISAPEGIDHILTQFPQVKIIVGAHDERLNSSGYIEPGLGDFGDKHFAELAQDEIESWRSKKILSEHALEALNTRLKV